MGTMTERDMRAVALGVAVGAAVGAAVALLLARRGPLVGVAFRPAGDARNDDRADLHARSRDMVAEGGPDDT